MDLGVVWPYLPQLLEGLLATLWLTVAATVTSLSAALLLALAASSNVGLLVRSVRVYTEIILGMPILVLVYLVYFVLPVFGPVLDGVTAGLLALTLYYSPYMAEAIRGALASIPAGQVEAARQIGMSEGAIFRRVLVPPSLGLMLPALTGLTIGLAKDTAILSVISVQELSFATKQVVSRTYAPIETWLVVAAMYWLFLSAFEVAMRRLEPRLLAFRATR